MKKNIFNYTLLLLATGALCSTPAFAGNEGEQDTDAIVLKKNIRPADDLTPGKFTIKLESYVTGSKIQTKTEKSAPLDVVMVLDRSSSMHNYSVNVTTEDERTAIATGQNLEIGKEYIVTIGSTEYLVKGFQLPVYSYAPRSGTNWNVSDLRNQTGYYYKVDDFYYEVSFSREGSGSNRKYYASYKNNSNNSYWIKADGSSTTTKTDVTTINTTLYSRTISSYEYVYRCTTDLNATLNNEAAGIKFFDADNLFTFGTDTALLTGTITKVEEYTRGGTERVTRLEAMERAALAFLDVIYQDALNNPDIEHQISIANFNGYHHNFGTRDVQLCDVEANYEALRAAINSNGTDYASGTLASEGLDKALTEFSTRARPTSGDDAASRVLLFFTDGKPDSGNGTSDFSDSVQDDGERIGSITAVEKAFEMKNDYDVTIHSVLLQSENPDTQFNYFLNMISSNYTDIADLNIASPVNASTGYRTFPSATTIGTGKGSEDPNGEDSYYYFSNGSDLTAIFSKIAESTTTKGKTYELTEESSAIIDIVSANFVLPEGTTKNDIRCWVESYIGGANGFDDPNNWAKAGEEGYYYSGAAPRPDVPEGTNTVTVTNFNFSLDDSEDTDGNPIYGNWVGSRTINGVTTYAGNKVVFEFDVMLNDNYSGGFNMPSNDIRSGVYVKTTDEEGNEVLELVKNFPPTSYDFPSLCIVKHGLAANESAIFTIDGPDYHQTVVLTQKATANGDLLPCYTVVKKLEKGGTYRVTETSWSWTYDATVDPTKNLPYIEQDLDLFVLPEGVTGINPREYVLSEESGATPIYSGHSAEGDTEIGLKLQDAAGQWYAVFKDLDADDYIEEYGNSALSILYEFNNSAKSTTSKPAHAENYVSNTFTPGSGKGGRGTQGGGQEDGPAEEL